MSERTRPLVDWEERSLRSLLFAPGNHPRKLEKVGGFGSDAIVLDLEDAVADAEKTAARQPVRAALSTYAAPTIVFGLGDFSVDIGVDLTADATELLYGRSRVVVAARAARLRPPLDGPWLDLQNIEGLVTDTLRSRQLGFQGRVVVYPPQVDHVQRAYSDLSQEEAERAQRVVEAFEQAEGEGSASIQVDGRFIDYPIYARAKEKLRLFRALRDEARTPA